MGASRPLTERLAEKVTEEPGGCHRWTGAQDGHGYGHMWGGQEYGGRYVKAYRAAWELAHGPIPAGLELDHLCRNTWCVNPEHLEPVTSSENKRRSWAHRERPEACPKGHVGEWALRRRATGTLNRDCLRCKREQTRARRAAQ